MLTALQLSVECVILNTQQSVGSRNDCDFGKMEHFTAAVSYLQHCATLQWNHVAA